MTWIGGATCQQEDVVGGLIREWLAGDSREAELMIFGALLALGSAQIGDHVYQADPVRRVVVSRPTRSRMRRLAGEGE
jgi:hypothetical protein